MTAFHNQDLQTALNSISPDCSRDQWFRHLAALKTELGEPGKEVAREWSQRSDKFDHHAFESTWNSLSPGYITGGSILYAATGRSFSLPKRNVTPIPLKKDTYRKAKSMLSGASHDDEYVSTHPYWQARLAPLHDRGLLQISAYGAARGIASGSVIGKRQDCLLLPMLNFEFELTGVECINADGAKQHFGKNGMLFLGNTLDKSIRVYVTEGWADAVSAWGYYGRDGSDVLAVATFGKGRQRAVAEQLEARGHDVILVLDGKKS